MKKEVTACLVSIAFMVFAASAARAEGAGPAALPPVVKEMVAKAKASVQKVSVAEVKAVLDRKEKAFLLDVRDGEEYATGHLPGALNISRGTLEMHVFGKIPDREAKIYVYCKTSIRSALATQTLHELGYPNAILLDASLEDWSRAGYPVIQ